MLILGNRVLFTLCVRTPVICILSTDFKMPMKMKSLQNQINPLDQEILTTEL